MWGELDPERLDTSYDGPCSPGTCGGEAVAAHSVSPARQNIRTKAPYVTSFSSPEERQRERSALSQHRFKYALSWRCREYACLAVIIMSAALSAWVVLHRGDVSGLLIVPMFDGPFGLIYIVGKLAYSTILVDDQSITALAFGLAWRTIAWREVESVRWARTAYIDGNVSVPFLSVQICSSDRKLPYFWPSGPIVVSEQIVDFQVLFETVREKARTRGFPIVKLF
jgi:hypothetical protein